MTALRRMAVAAIAAAGVLATAGCATTLAGTPVPATTPAAADLSTSATPGTGAEPGAGTVAGSAGATASHGPGDPQPGSAAPGVSGQPTAATTPSAIRPMPPLDATRPGAPVSTDGSDPQQPGAGGADGADGAGGADGADGPLAVDLTDVVAQLSDGRVARVESAADLDALRLLAAQADAAGMPTSIVVIGTPIPDTSTSTITDRLWTDLGDTVVVLSPTLVSARSDLLSSQQRDDAVQAAADAADDENAVLTFLNAALGDLGLANPLTMPPPTSEVVAGIDVAAAVAAIGPNHIAISPGATNADEEQVRPAVEDAWERGVSLYVVVLSRDATGPLTDVSRAIMRYTGGTVLVISPQRFALSSVTFTDDELSTVLDDAGAAESYGALVSVVVDKLTG